MRVYYPEVGLTRHCRLFGKSRQAYYQWEKKHNSSLLFETLVVELIEEIRVNLKNQQLGGRKLLLLLNEKLSQDGLQIGRDRLYVLMGSNGLLVRKRKRKAQTTNSSHNLRRYPNLIKGKEITRPEEVWVSDITYLRVGGGFNYLSLVSDAYSRKIVGYCLYPDLSAKGPEEALLMALSERANLKGKLIHHSDQGIQYCSHNYVSLLNTSGISISMSRKGSPQENAIAERINGILKTEYELNKKLSNTEEAKRKVDEAIYSYNWQRPHMKLNMQTPEQVHNVNQYEEQRDRQTIKSRNTIMSVK